jgi:hypothetical protein
MRGLSMIHRITGRQGEEERDSYSRLRKQFWRNSIRGLPLLYSPNSQPVGKESKGKVTLVSKHYAIKVHSGMEVKLQ